MSARPAVAPDDHFDVLVIGSGPAGGSLAAELAPTGKRIAVLERGDYLPRERENWSSEEVFGIGRYNTSETFYDRHDKPFTPEMHPYVGGNAKLYGAALYRMLPQNFSGVTHPKGVTPAWPISYDDFEPYYVRAERRFWVHGTRGEDPFAGPASAPYDHDAIPHEPRIQALSDGLAKLGLHPFHMPMGVALSTDATGNATLDSTCIRCNRVDGFPCLLKAKADGETAALTPAMAEHDNLVLFTNTTVTALGTDDAGRTVSYVYTTGPDGVERTFSADIVVLSAGSILSSVLLLRSANDAHPRGLANGSDVVGRHYMRHNNMALMAFSREENPTVFQKTLTFNDYYGPSDKWEFPMGNIQMLGKSDDWQVKGEAPKLVDWGPKFAYGQVAKHSIDFWLASEDLPLPDSRVTLRDDGSVKLTVQPDNNEEGLKRLRHTFDSMLGDLDLHSKTFERSVYLHKGMDVSATAHQAGTVRFGDDPASSALDRDCKAHELDNLYVVDGSFMPSIGAVNPTLTIVANAIRVSDRIRERITA